MCPRAKVYIFSSEVTGVKLLAVRNLLRVCVSWGRESMWQEFDKRWQKRICIFHIHEERQIYLLKEKNMWFLWRCHAASHLVYAAWRLNMWLTVWIEVAAIVHQNDILQKIRRRSSQYCMNCAQQCWPRLIMEYYDYTGPWKIWRIFEVEASEKKQIRECVTLNKLR